MTAQIAVVTALLATVSVLFSYMGGVSQTNAGLYKSNAAIKKTEAASQWNDFHFKSTKQSLTQFVRDLETDEQRAAYLNRIARYEKEKNDLKIGNAKLPPEIPTKELSAEEQVFQNQRWVQAEFARDLAAEAQKAAYQGEIARYEKEKNNLKTSAYKLEAEALSWDKSAEEQMQQHQRWAQATTVLQISIALAAIALLTRKKWLEYAMFALAGVGVALGGQATLHMLSGAAALHI
jgi:cell division protein FtsB